MIRENQKLLNRLNVLSDAGLIYLTLPLAYWLRFFVMPDGFATVPLSAYLRIGIGFTMMQLFTYSAFGVYRTTRITRISKEMKLLLEASLLDMLLLLGWLFLRHNEHYSRWVLILFFVMSTSAVVCKHMVVRKGLRALREQGNNLKYVLVLGGGRAAERYLSIIEADRELGYQAMGYLAEKSMEDCSAPYLGNYDMLKTVLEHSQPDEVISAIETADFDLTPYIINCCEAAGIKLSIVPFYVDYMPANPQLDDLNGLPLLNIRRVPLDNFSNAFVKRAMDIAGALILLVLTSPLLLISSIGIRLTSPGPVLFRQVRIGKDRKPFTMLKLRTMRVNDAENTAWSTQEDERRTRLGAVLRKLSLDEVPQAINILRGEMSLVGPRPEMPRYVDQFKNDIPLYMVRHQVRPGITGWAQINGYRGDTPIRERVEHDIWYIENWSVWLDIRILLATVFRGQFINDEKLRPTSKPEKETIRKS